MSKPLQEMSKDEMVALLRTDVREWNRLKKEYLGVRLDLNEADLSGAKLGKVNLCGAVLNEANLVWANLFGATLNEANLIWTDLSEANLIGAVLNEANLNEANLIGADLSRADLSRAKLVGTRLYETTFGNTLLPSENLKPRFKGPCTIDMRTIRKSWPLPKSFLRGCGLDDYFIDLLPSLMNEPIQFDSCFISYSSKDDDFARRLHADLQDRGVRCWFAPHDMKGGEKLHEQIKQAIHLQDRLLLVLSENSMDSEWVKTEIATARQREIDEKRRVLFPISLAPFEEIKRWKCFDADTGKDSAREIREYFIPDFTQWKHHDAYQKALDRLVRDLKAG